MADNKKNLKIVWKVKTNRWSNSQKTVQNSLKMLFLTITCWFILFIFYYCWKSHFGVSRSVLQLLTPEPVSQACRNFRMDSILQSAAVFKILLRKGHNYSCELKLSRYLPPPFSSLQRYFLNARIADHRLRDSIACSITCLLVNGWSLDWFLIRRDKRPRVLKNVNT